jgi:hypothetical protein
VVSDDAVAEVVELLIRDVQTARGGPHADQVHYYAEMAREYCEAREDFAYKVVEDVQQYLMDCFIDTTWPACPFHPNHPMWFENGMWCADGKPVAKLGELGEWLRRART